jgi:hypothetical protein
MANIGTCSMEKIHPSKKLYLLCLNFGSSDFKPIIYFAQFFSSADKAEAEAK